MACAKWASVLASRDGAVDCSVPKVEYVCPNNCSYHGTCVKGKCNCNRGWTGVDCSNLQEMCPDDYICYHGVCNAMGHCDCDEGYTGDDCSLGPFYGTDLQ